MSNILKIDSSARLEDSHSRNLSEYFLQNWISKFPAALVVNRDLVQNPIGHIDQDTITGFYTPEDALTDELRSALELSDALIEELRQAEHLVLSVPIYNFSMPSSLKAWIDHVVRIGQTFSYDGENFEGLLKMEEATVICVYGASGYLEGEAFYQANFLEPYITFLLGFIGIKDVNIISLQATTGDENELDKNIEKAKQKIDNVIEAL